MANVYVDETFLGSAEAQGLQGFARCGECLARISTTAESLTNEQRASLQWVRCAQCSAGTAPWYRRCIEGR